MKILVLGGTGAMGVDLVNILAGGGINRLTVTSRSKRSSELVNVRYVQGDAHDMAFLKTLLREDLDAIIDFMVYDTNAFRARRDLLLGAAKQYLFLSSSRVYAGSVEPLTEDSPRLLDVTEDNEYLKTDEYALAKARQENLLRESGKTNWTIIRPYITYSNQRLQLGVFEKELWLYRALRGQTVLVPKEILRHTTTLTCGEDVARGIAALVGNPNAYGQTVYITTEIPIRWSEVLALYQRVLCDTVGRPMKVVYVDSPEEMGWSMRNWYQIKYDRLFDRRFDNAKRKQLTGKWILTAPEDGLERCLREFLTKPKFRELPPRAQAWMDRATGEYTSLRQFRGIKSKIKYVIGRYTPYFRIKAKGTGSGTDERKQKKQQY